MPSSQSWSYTGIWNMVKENAGKPKQANHTLCCLHIGIWTTPVALKHSYASEELHCLCFLQPSARCPGNTSSSDQALQEGSRVSHLGHTVQTGGVNERHTSKQVTSTPNVNKPLMIDFVFFQFPSLDWKDFYSYLNHLIIIHTRILIKQSIIVQYHVCAWCTLCLS